MRSGRGGIRLDIVAIGPPRAGKQPVAEFELRIAVAVGEEAVMADAMEAVRERVQEKGTPTVSAAL